MALVMFFLFVAVSFAYLTLVDYQKKKNSIFGNKIYPASFFFSIMMMVVSVYGFSLIRSERILTIEVLEKTIKRSHNDDIYLVSTKENGVFKIEDSFFLWKFDSSDKYFLIKEDQRYRVICHGWRVHFFSMYPNIHSIEKVSK